MAAARSATRSSALEPSATGRGLAALALRDDPFPALSVLLAIATMSTWIWVSLGIDVARGAGFTWDGPWPWFRELTLAAALGALALAWLLARLLGFVSAGSGAGIRLAVAGLVARGVARLSWTMMGAATMHEWEQGGVSSWAPYAGLVATLGTVAFGAGIALVVYASVADVRRGRPRLRAWDLSTRLPMGPWIRPPHARPRRPLPVREARAHRRARGRGLGTFAVRALSYVFAVPAAYVLWSVAWAVAAG